MIIASIHNRYKLDEADMTRRVVTAMKNPLFKIWGHPLGRLVQRRPPIACRVEEVLDVIAESRAAIEINGDPHRLDMEPRWLKEGAQARHQVCGLHRRALDYGSATPAVWNWPGAARRNSAARSVEYAERQCVSQARVA